MKQILFVLALFFVLAVPDVATAQNIRAAGIVGFNATQVRGDDLAGFHKFGLNLGAMGVIPLSDRFNVSLEILYSQKGSRTLPNRLNPGAIYLLRLNYADVPILINYEDKDFVSFGTGLSVGRLVGVYEERFGTETLFPEGPPYKKTDLQFVASGTYYFLPQWGLNLRYSYSILAMGHNLPFSSSTFVEAQRSSVVTTRLVWMFGRNTGDFEK